MNVGYARVSTSSQNLENQIDQLKDAGCVKIFSEKKSGKNKADRQQFNIMMDFVREGDILFITKLDRLARSVIDLQNIAKFLEDKNVDLKVIQQNIYTTTPAGRLLFTMLGAIAEFERDLINERVREGIEAAKRKGVQFVSSAIQKCTTMQCKSAPLCNTYLAEISNNPASRFCFNL